jgi:hypothetical protein
MKIFANLFFITFLLSSTFLFGQNGSSGQPFTSLGQAQNVTVDGVYYFNLSGTTFSTWVRTGGWVQVAIDYGGGIGNMPQSSTLNNSSRGILNTTVLSTLTTANKARIIVSTGAVDVTSTNATHLSRIRSNSALSVGGNDNTLSDSWVGTGATYLTTNAGSCNSTSNNGLHQRVIHIACNVNGMHWIPFSNEQKVFSNQGNIASNQYFQLLVQAPLVAVVLGPTINTQPSNVAQNLCLNGTSTALSVSATSPTTITYQWYSNNSASNTGGTAISGANTASYTPPTNQAGTKYYYVICTNSQGSTTSAVSAAITVSPISVGGAASSTQTICYGFSPAAITVSGHTGSVQWQVSTDNVTFTNISGATSATLTSAQMGTLTAIRYYRAMVTSGTCTSAYSTVVTVNITPLPTISSVAAGAVCNSGTVTLSAMASSGTLRWYNSVTGGSLLSTGSSYTTPNISATTTYYVDLTDNGCTSFPRTAVIATVNALPAPASNTPGQLNTEVLVVAGGGAGGFRHGGGGGAGGVIYQSSFNVNAGSYPVTVGAGGVGNSAGDGGTAARSGGSGGGGSNGRVGGSGTAGQGNKGGDQNNGSGCCHANGAGGGGAGAAAANTTGSVSSAGGDGVSYSISGTATYYGGGGGGGNSTATSLPGGLGGGGAGGRSNSMTGSNALANTGSGGGGGGANGSSSGNGGNGGSGIVLIKYEGAPIATGGVITQLGGYTIHTFNSSGTFAFSGSPTASVPNVSSCSPTSFNITGTVASGYTLDWYDSITGGNLLLSGSNTFTTPVLNTTTVYYVAVRNTSTGCVSSTRTAVNANIYSSPALSVNQNICAGNQPSTISINGTSGSIQWQVSSDNTSFSNISGATSATLSSAQMGTLTSTRYYRAVVSGGACGNVTSASVIVTVANPTISTTVPASVCGSGSVSLSASASSSVAVINWYFWRK